jgi:hypothetical protein
VGVVHDKYKPFEKKNSLSSSHGLNKNKNEPFDNFHDIRPRNPKNELTSWKNK